MIAEYNRKSFYWGVPGFLLQMFPRIMVPIYLAGIDPTQPASNAITAAYILLLELIGLGGTVLLLIGIAHYAKSRARHWAWCFLAFIPLVGLIILACLKDKSPVPADASQDPQSPGPPKTSRLAVYSLILGILGFVSFGLTSLPGLITGIIAMQRIRSRPLTLKGRGMAIAGLVLSIIPVVCVSIVVLHSVLSDAHSP